MLNVSINTLYWEHIPPTWFCGHSTISGSERVSRFGNSLVLQKPERDEWGSGTEALECALQLEKSVNQSLLDLHKLCSDHNDPHVSTEESQSTALAHILVTAI